MKKFMNIKITSYVLATVFALGIPFIANAEDTELQQAKEEITRLEQENQSLKDELDLYEKKIAEHKQQVEEFDSKIAAQKAELESNMSE